MPTLTPDQVKQYYSEEGNKPSPMSPFEWLAKQTPAPSTPVKPASAPTIVPNSTQSPSLAVSALATPLNATPAVPQIDPAQQQKMALDTIDKNLQDFQLKQEINPETDYIKTITDVFSKMPETPDYASNFKSMLESQGYNADQTQLTAIDQEINALKEEQTKKMGTGMNRLAKTKFGLESNQRLQQLFDQKAVLQSGMQMKMDTINNLMSFTKQSYTDAMAQYDQKMSAFTNISNILENREQRQFTRDQAVKSDAQANLKVIQDNVKEYVKAGKDFNSLPDSLKTQIGQLEMASGMPLGSTQQLLSELQPDEEEVWKGLSEDGTILSQIVRKSDGTVETRKYATNLPAKAGSESSTIEAANVNPNSASILSQTGISSPVFNYLTQGTSSMTRMAEGTRKQIMAEADKFLNSRGLDYSTFVSRYKAYNETLTKNITRYNNSVIMEGEILGTIENLSAAADEASFGKLKVGNVAKYFAGEQVNDPNVLKYGVHLNQLVTEMAGYNAAVQGKSSPDLAEIEEAKRVIKNGLSSGSLKGFTEAIEASTKKMGTILQGSVDRSNKQVWDLFGVGENYKKQNQPQSAWNSKATNLMNKSSVFDMSKVNSTFNPESARNKYGY